MNIQEIADRLVKLSRQGNIQTCYDELYASDIVSIEPEGFPGDTKSIGMDAVMLKLKQVAASVKEVHSTEIGDPMIADSHFALRWKTHLTYHKSTDSTVIDEIAVYEVESGKIVSEQFFYKT